MNDPKPPPTSEMLRQLKTASEGMVSLSEQVVRLSDALLELSRRVRRSRVMILTVIVGFILDIALTVTLTIVAVEQNNNTEAIHNIQDRTSQQVLCPLYQIFLNARSDQARAVYPQGTAAYDKAFNQIQHGYNVLGCTTKTGG